MTRIRLIVLTVALSVSFVTAAAPAQQPSQLPEFDTTNAVAFVEFDSSHMVIKSYEEAEFRRHVRIRILRESGIEHAIVAIAKDKFRKPTEFEGRAISANGVTVLRRDLSDMVEACGFGGDYTLFNDICINRTNLSAGNLPFTVEFSYTQQFRSLFAWHGWEPQDEIPVVLASYVLEVPDEISYRSHETNFDGIQNSGRTESGVARRTEWSIRDLPPGKSSECSPPPFDTSPRLAFTPQQAKLGEFYLNSTSWSSLASSFARVYSTCYSLPTEAINEAKTLIAFSEDGVPQLGDFHRTMMSRLRYVAVYLGIGGWQPHAALSTYRNRYGDCKDLATLYIAMLAQVGIAAYPALLLTKDEGRLEDQFITLSPFNHAIVLMVSGTDTTWIDPTCSTCAFGDLPKDDEGVLALVLDPANGRLVMTPLSSPEENARTKSTRLTITEDLSAELEVAVKATGNPGAQLQSYCRAVDLKEFEQVLSLIGALPGSAKEIKSKSDRQDSTLSHFSCTASAHLPRSVRRLGNKAYIDLSEFVWGNSCENLDLIHRSTPVDLTQNAVLCDTIQIAFPSAWKITSAPIASNIESDFGSTSLSIDQDAGAITILVSQVLLPSLVFSDDFPALAEYQKASRELTRAKIVFETR